MPSSTRPTSHLPAHLDLSSSPETQTDSVHTQTTATGTVTDAIDLSSDDDDDDCLEEAKGRKRAEEERERKARWVAVDDGKGKGKGRPHEVLTIDEDDEPPTEPGTEPDTADDEPDTDPDPDAPSAGVTRRSQAGTTTRAGAHARTPPVLSGTRANGLKSRRQKSATPAVEALKAANKGAKEAKAKGKGKGKGKGKAAGTGVVEGWTVCPVETCDGAGGEVTSDNSRDWRGPFKLFF